MSLSIQHTSRWLMVEQSSEDMGLATKSHLWEYPGSLNAGGSYESGTASNKFDLVWTDSRTLVATTEDLDLRGVLTASLGGAVLNMVEVCGIAIKNTSLTTALVIGNGTNGAYLGMFGAVTHTITVPPGGKLEWFAPVDGGGLTTTAGTADILKVNSGAATIVYEIAVFGRSA